MDYMLKKRLISLIFPTRCPVCGEVIFPHEDFCGKCNNELTEYKGGFKISEAKSFTAPFEYDEKISPAVILLKRGIKGNAVYALGEALAAALENHGISQKVDIIIPVPLYKSDKRERGFNQAELIAREVGRTLKIDVSTDIVKKVRKTTQQKTLSKRERKVNLINAFDVSIPDKIKDKRILLIDDVCTTGSTLTEITVLLRKNGAAEVHCAVCCKTPDIRKEDENYEQSR
ncbi:MAG: ComF family protein [Ruminococcus sp.]|nr:ComF family protein [Ruminococcus sp.]